MNWEVVLVNWEVMSELGSGMKSDEELGRNE